MRDGWTDTTLGDVADVVMGRQLSPSKRMGTRPRPYLRAANIGNWGISLDDVLEMDFTEDEENHFSNRIGDVLMVEGGNEKSVGCPALVTEREAGLCIQNTIIRCRVKESLYLSPEFLYHFLRYCFWVGKFGELCAGTTIMHLGQKRAVVFPLVLPPLDEQKRIVDVVSSVDAYIDALQQQADSARTARNAVLHEMLFSSGDDWTETTLGELCEIYQPETISKAKMDDRAAYIVYGANGPVGRYSRFNHEEPEVVVTCRGATCGVVNMTPPNCWITGNAMVVRPRDNRSTKDFLFWALQISVDVQAVISGSAQPQITRTGLAPSKIKVPPIVEQNRIVEIVSSMDEVIKSTEQAVTDAKNLRSGLLSDLLSGEHEIPESYDVFVGAA
jgi:type I restriction enzyme S subunit